MVDDDFSYLEAERNYRPVMGDPQAIRTVRETPWELSGSGQYEARAEVVVVSTGKFFFSIEKSQGGGDIGYGPDWRGPFTTMDAATAAGRRAAADWLRSVDPD